MKLQRQPDIKDEKVARSTAEAFAGLYEQYLPKIFRYISYRVADTHMAADMKVQRLRLEEQYQKARARWMQEKRIDNTVNEEDIAELVAKWTGIPVSRMLETEDG